MSVEENLKQQLAKLPDITVLYLNSDTKSYYKSMLATIDFMVNNLGYGGVIVSSTRPVSDIRVQMQVSGIPLNDIQFVDSVVYLVGGKTEDENTAYVESPAMLETIMLKVDWQLKQIRSEDKFVFFDSMNGLTIYNEEKLLLEFIHVFANNMRLKDIYTILISVKEQTPEAIDSILRLNCDDTIEIREHMDTEVDGNKDTSGSSISGDSMDHESLDEEELQPMDNNTDSRGEGPWQ